MGNNMLVAILFINVLAIINYFVLIEIKADILIDAPMTRKNTNSFLIMCIIMLLAILIINVLIVINDSILIEMWLMHELAEKIRHYPD